MSKQHNQHSTGRGLHDAAQGIRALVDLPPSISSETTAGTSILAGYVIGGSTAGVSPLARGAPLFNPDGASGDGLYFNDGGFLTEAGVM